MSELEKRFHRVVGSMIGNESLAVSLDDDAAGELLSWGKAAARRIVDETAGMDDVEAEERMMPRLRALRVMMRAAEDGWGRQAVWMPSRDRHCGTVSMNRRVCCSVILLFCHPWTKLWRNCLRMQMLVR
jgi:hypothetical protein